MNGGIVLYEACKSVIKLIVPVVPAWVPPSSKRDGHVYRRLLL